MKSIMERVDYLDEVMAELARTQIRMEIASDRRLSRMEADTRRMKEKSDRLEERLEASYKESREKSDRLEERLEASFKEMREKSDRLEESLQSTINEMKEDTVRMKEKSDQMDERLEASFKEMREKSDRLEESLQSTINEMKEDTVRMKEKSDQMDERLEASFKEMREESAEMDEWVKSMIKEMKEDRARMNKAWGDLANKMGTVAEDVVKPNIPRLAVEEFGFSEVEDLVARPRRTSRRGKKREAEYDVVCAGPGKVVVVEVKSTPTAEKIRAVPGRLAEFFDFYPEYEGRELIGAFASWSIDARLLPVISECGLYGIAMGEETMDVVARPGEG